MKKLNTIIPACAVLALLVGCGKKEEHGHGHPHAESTNEEEHGHPHAEPGEDGEHGHEHAEEEGHDEAVALGKFDIEGISVEAAQGHGSVKAGKESHLVIKLPLKDDGETVVRAWIGVADRTLSSVGKGDYSASTGGYDIHSVAPDPLSDGSQWWIEIETPDGTKAVGSVPLLKDVLTDP